MTLHGKIRELIGQYAQLDQFLPGKQIEHFVGKILDLTHDFVTIRTFKLDATVEAEWTLPLGTIVRVAQHQKSLALMLEVAHQEEIEEEEKSRCKNG